MRLNLLVVFALSVVVAACTDPPRPAARAPVAAAPSVAASAPYTPTPEEQRKIQQWADCVVPVAFNLDDGRSAPETIARQAVAVCRHLSLIPEARDTEIVARVIREKREKERTTGRDWRGQPVPASTPPARSGGAPPPLIPPPLIPPPPMIPQQD